MYLRIPGLMMRATTNITLLYLPGIYDMYTCIVELLYKIIYRYHHAEQMPVPSPPRPFDVIKTVPSCSDALPPPIYQRSEDSQFLILAAG